MGTKVAAPPPRDYGAETDATLKAQVANAPALYESEAKYSPLYSALGVKELETGLLGTPQQRGLLDIYKRDLYPAMSEISAASDASQREADISAIERLGRRSTEAFRSANPEMYGLLGRLTDQASTQLDAGGRLDPELARETQQAIRSAQAARGMGYGNADVFQEALGMGSMAEARRSANQQFAAQVLGLHQATSADPSMAILGRPSTSFYAGPQMAGQAAGIAGNQPTLFNPESGYASDVYNTNYNAANARYMNRQNFWGGILGGALGAAGSIGGGFMGRPR